MYDTNIDEKWRRYWSEKRLFLFDEKSQDNIYTIDTPPPFTNGALHMGQVFWVSYIDSIARYKRMRGFNVLYPQGWDAHGFPTEIAVEKKYGKSLSREEFYNKCVEESTSNISTMREQMLRLGASFDSRYEYTTISEDYMKRVQLSVLEMYEKGFVYRALHPVEWCVTDITSISREQAIEREEESELIYLNFKIVGSKSKSLAIATTRPELLHACVAVAVNPGDERFKELIGKRVRAPLFGNTVEVIGDEHVDPAFGTGAEMVCTFGDKIDIDMYYRHNLKLIESLTEEGKLKNAGKFTGMKIKDGRSAIINELESLKEIVKRESIKHIIKVHDRCSTPVEFISSMQWFIRTKEHSEKIKSIAQEINWIPDFARQRLEDWANFIEWDWAISRNRIFGTPIPFWYCSKCNGIVPADEEGLPVDPVKHKAPVEKCPKCKSKLVGETNTLDGWIDSSITPLVIAAWPNRKDPKMRGFPNSIRIQGTDIIRTWAFYTIFRTWALTGNKPWENIIAHSMILGTDGREMHKSWGNGVYPDELMKKYSVDAIRLWVSLCGGITKDKPFSYQDLDYAKTFTTKLFNTANFVKLAIENGRMPKEEPHSDFNIFDIWILNRFNSIAMEVTEAYDNYSLYEAMSKSVNFYWHEFADYYIENVKHRVYSKEKRMEKSRDAALYTLRYICLNTLKLLAPVIPYIAEETNSMFSNESIFMQGWPKHARRPQKSSDYIINGIIFKNEIADIDVESMGAFLNSIISEVRKAKAKEKKALNYEIASININVPEEYYSVTSSSKDEIAQICKARKVEISKGKYSVEIAI